MTIRTRPQPTTSAAELKAQLRDARDARYAAAQAEDARLAAERQHAEKIAAEDARIAKLEGQLASAALSEAAQRDQEHNAANMMAYNDLIDALNTITPDLLSRVDEAWNALSDQITAQRENALRGMQQYQAQIIRESHNQPSPNHAYMHQQNALIQAQRKFTTPLPIFAAFIMWVKGAKTPEERRFRQGIGFAFFGVAYEPPPDVTEDQLRANHAAIYWPQ